MADEYGTLGNQLDSPVVGGFAIVPSDSTLFSQPTRALWVGFAGNLSIQFIDGTTATLSAVPGGALLPIRVSKVMAASTAGNIIGLY